jgi:hypothetical protein
MESDNKLVRNSFNASMRKMGNKHEEEEFPDFEHTDEGVEDKQTPYCRVPNFLVLLKQSMLPTKV